MKNINPQIKDILVCRQCDCTFTAENAVIACGKCGRSYPLADGMFDFLNTSMDHLKLPEAGDLRFQMEQMYNNSLTAKIIKTVSGIVSCDYVPFGQLVRFIKKIKDDSVFVEFGSGNRRLRNNCINVDLFPFPNVDILADINSTPFGDNTVDFAVIDAVLEHVPEPHSVVNELHRILKPGGEVFCVVPFIHQYHGYPRNYFNISSDGIEYLFKNFKTCRIETYRGPSSALISLFAEYAALAFSGGKKNFLYAAFRGGALLPMFMLKYLDRFWSPAGPAMRISNALCAVVTK
jgi:SAM-dependent methyltransferase